MHEEFEAQGVEFLAVISGYYGGPEFTRPEQADDYISSRGLHIAATHDPEHFWGGFSESIPSNIYIDLQTMRIVRLSVNYEETPLRNELNMVLGNL